MPGGVYSVPKSLGIINPTMWVNTAVAQYYGFNSISVLK